MMYIWIIITLQTIWIPSSKASPIQDVYFPEISSELSKSGEYVPTQDPCDEMSISQWSSDFHECFMNRKYKDGGTNLESIVDRIMDHAEACVETSGKDCRPDFEGFKKILGRVFEQMKDYSNMYLQEIYKGRDKIKDLKCVEETLSMSVYDSCFNNLSTVRNKTDYELQNAVRDGIRCTNKENVECSKEARTSLNRIVRTIFGLEQPPEEDEMEEKEKPPPPKKWYDYITDPFVAAWNAISNFFSGMFG